MRQCVFCTNPANSREHIWANWLRNYVPHTQINHVETRIDLDARGGETIAETRVSGDPRSRKLKVVCSACNNGWMSQVQDRAKPHLVRLISGEKFDLPRQARAALSRWAALFTTVQEYIHVDLVSVSQKERECLRTRSTAPANWVVWLGRFVDPDGHSRSSRNAIPVVTREEFVARRGHFEHFKYNGQSSTFLVGPILFHTISTPRRLRFTFPSEVERKLLRIWPTNDQKMPWPTDTLSEDDYSTLTDEMRKRVEERHPWLAKRR